MKIHKKNHDFGLLFFVRDSRHDKWIRRPAGQLGRGKRLSRRLAWSSPGRPPRAGPGSGPASQPGPGPAIQPGPGPRPRPAIESKPRPAIQTVTRLALQTGITIPSLDIVYERFDN